MTTRGSTGTLAVVFACGFLLGASPLADAGETAAYRDFRLGMTVAEVAAQTGLPPADVKVVVQRPLLIQELLWRPPSLPGVTGSLPERDSVAQVLFGFCDGALYRMVVGYDPEKTVGLTDQDLIDALSVQYGATRPSKPLASIITSPASQGFVESELVTAKWESAGSAVYLFRGGYRSTFGLVIADTTQAPLARAGIQTSLRLAQLDAPQRELAEQKLRDDAEAAVRTKARVANKLAFRY